MLITYKNITQQEITDNNIDTIALMLQPNPTISTEQQVKITTFEKDKNDFRKDDTFISNCVNKLVALSNRFSTSITKPVNEYYEVFQIPKSSGGWREISSPQYPLKGLLTDFKNLLQYDFQCLAHDSAYAYVPERSTVHAVKKHQEGNSNWFLKLDIHDFFGSHTKEFILNSLQSLYPFTYIMESEEGYNALNTILCHCMLNGGLPQGSPTSPILTNLCMIPFDFAMEKHLTYFKNAKITYTRYADDMIISSYYKFNYRELVEEVKKLLSELTPFEINETKTRFGSKNGRNWNLGLMYNKDGEVTVGWRNKRDFKHNLHAFMTATERMNPGSVQEFMGLVSYYLMIEKDYFSYIIRKYELKNRITLKAKANWHLNLR